MIAGVGVRKYYRNNGYSIDSVEGCYQIKLLDNKNKNDQKIKLLFILILVIVLLLAMPLFVGLIFNIFNN